MTVDQKTYREISEAARSTPDPERAERSLLRFIELNPGTERIFPHLPAVAGLFAVSRFLANYCIACPGELYAALDEIRTPVTKGLLDETAAKELSGLSLSGDGRADIRDMMRALRLFRKRRLLRITLRDITGETDIRSCMYELTMLAETVISQSLGWALKLNRQRFGEPAEEAVALIAVGKLGGEELNYSSDVDLMAVYGDGDGQTSGILNPSGVTGNRISNHEFYCRTIELFNRMLSSQTEDGIACRVDLRLRPQGQKGEIALPLGAYRTYYESWGRTWERMALIRARPAAGDGELGKAFLETIEPFVWKKTVDYPEIEEIRGLKKKIDSTITIDDIKRGYGGIREAEFFIQTFQLLYASAESSLKTHRILDAVESLKRMNIVPANDLDILRGNYLHLRRIEHFLQMKEDLQTHTLPSSAGEMRCLARSLGFTSETGFLEDLRLRRMQVKSMYNSLFGTREDVHAEALNLLEGELSEREIRGYLSFRKVRHPDKCTAHLKGIREHAGAFRTTQERSLTRRVLPPLLENALSAESPDRALAGLESLLTTYRIKTVHLTALMEQKELMDGIIKMFSLSPYLTRIFLSSQYYLDMLIEEWRILKSLGEIEEKLERTAGAGDDFNSGLARYRRCEEVRLGILFLLDILKTEDLFTALSHVAEAIIRAIVRRNRCSGLSVIALGKLGGREMTFGSDIDMVFVSETQEAMTAAEKIMKELTSYTDTGLLYSVDTRLRPDGSKGILVKNMEGYRNYYFKNARNWEIQALLKARPVAGNRDLAAEFTDMTRAVILQRGSDVNRDDIAAVRDRIIKELSHESEGMDIKLGPGGIEEIEFYVQFLQLHHARAHPGILARNTLKAVRKLAEEKLLDPSAENILYNAYEYLRKLETFLRLNEEQVIAARSDVAGLSARFMGHGSREEFTGRLQELRRDVLSVTGARETPG